MGNIGRVMDDVSIANSTHGFLLDKGKRVKLHNKFAEKNLDRKGTIVGHSIVSGGQQVYLIDLDGGFYSPEQDMYVHTIVCSTDVVVELHE